MYGCRSRIVSSTGRDSTWSKIAPKAEPQPPCCHTQCFVWQSETCKTSHALPSLPLCKPTPDTTISCHSRPDITVPCSLCQQLTLFQRRHALSAQAQADSCHQADHLLPNHPLLQCCQLGNGWCCAAPLRTLQLPCRQLLPLMLPTRQGAWWSEPHSLCQWCAAIAASSGGTLASLSSQAVAESQLHTVQSTTLVPCNTTGTRCSRGRISHHEVVLTSHAWSCQV